MKRPNFSNTWPESWKLSYKYDRMEIYGHKDHAGYYTSYKNRRDKTLEVLCGQIKPGDKVLDIAAGQGNFSVLLAERGFVTYWNDLREELVDYVKLKHHKGELNFIPGNALELGFDRTFDAVLIAEVLEHVAQPSEFLTKISSFVKPGGVIVFSTPNGAFFRNRLPSYTEVRGQSELSARQFKPDGDGHLFLLKKEEIELIVNEAGLKIDSLHVINNLLTGGNMGLRFALMVIPEWLVRQIETLSQLLPRRLRMAIHSQFVGSIKVSG